MTKITSILKRSGVLIVVISALSSISVYAANTFDDEPEPGCDTLVSVNDFL